MNYEKEVGESWSSGNVKSNKATRRGSGVELKSFVDIVDVFRTERSESSMQALVDRARETQLTDEEISHLSRALVKSGQMISPGTHLITADIASTGGPSSLSTLLCPIYLRLAGMAVIKLAVPGRPAGGIDVLAQIPGYKVSLERNKILEVLSACGYVHCLVGDQNAPLDMDFYHFRKRVGAVDIPTLAIASLLAKKVTAGVQVAGLEVRVASHGNFGLTREEGRKNALTFCRVAERLGIKAVCFLTDASIPYQPFIGRGESLAALFLILNNKADPWLRKHQMLCYRMSQSLINLTKATPAGSVAFDHVVKDNLLCQGSSIELLSQRATNVLKGHTIEITSSDEGFLSINLDKIRSSIVSTQLQFTKHEGDFSDPCGLILAHVPGDYVLQGELLATLRVECGEIEGIRADLADAFTVTYGPSIEKEFEEITYA